MQTSLLLRLDGKLGPRPATNHPIRPYSDTKIDEIRITLKPVSIYTFKIIQGPLFICPTLISFAVFALFRGR